jgi:hypothetical protein
VQVEPVNQRQPHGAVIDKAMIRIGRAPEYIRRAPEYIRRSS